MFSFVIFLNFSWFFLPKKIGVMILTHLVLVRSRWEIITEHLEQSEDSVMNDIYCVIITSTVVYYLYLTTEHILIDGSV